MKVTRRQHGLPSGYYEENQKNKAAQIAHKEQQLVLAVVSSRYPS